MVLFQIRVNNVSDLLGLLPYSTFAVKSIKQSIGLETKSLLPYRNHESKPLNCQLGLRAIPNNC